MAAGLITMHEDGLGAASGIVGVAVPSNEHFAVSYFFFGPWTPLLQHAAISAAMAALPPLDSLAHVDMVDVAWVLFVPRPSDMSTALSTERGIHPRATVASQDLTVAPLEQTVAYAGEN